MPYDDERENLLGHRGIVSDDDVEARLRSLSVGPMEDRVDTESLTTVDTQEIERVDCQPEQVIAVDGSRAETPVDEERLNAQVGFVEVAVVEADITQLGKRLVRESQFVSPSVEAEAVNAEYIRMVFPSQNAYFEGEAPKPVGFRRMLYENFCEETVRGTPLLEFLTTLFNYQSRSTSDYVHLQNCPYRDEFGCNKSHDIPVDSLGLCDTTELPLFPTDRLRIHEYVSNRSSNQSAFTVVMKTVEQLAIGLAIQDWAQSRREADGEESGPDTAFIKDGPLAQFDTAAWISRAMSNYLHDLKDDDNLPVVVGLDKTGDFAAFAETIRDDIPAGTVVPMSSDFIYDMVKPQTSQEMFGRKTYYGKSFLYKTSNNYMFCLTLGPREFVGGDTNGVMAGRNPAFLHYEPNAYTTLGAALAAISSSELALYKDSVIPIHMAHDRATIPKNVGDKVLSELVEHELLGAERIYGR